MGLLVVFIVLLVLIVVTACFTVCFVRTGHVAIIERGGRFLTVLGPGVHVKIPYLDKRRDVDLHPEDAMMTFTVKSDDNLMADVDVAVQYHVTQPEFGEKEIADATGTIRQDDEAMLDVYRSVYAVRKPVERMRTYVSSILGQQAEGYSLSELFSNREVLDGIITSELHDKMLEYGFTVDDVLITSISVPDDIKKSWERVAMSHNEIDVKKNIASAEGAVDLIKAKGEASVKAAEGQGIADRQRAIADGMGYTVKKLHEAGLSYDRTNDLLKFSQHTDMLGRYAESNPTVIIDSGYGKHMRQIPPKKRRRGLPTGRDEIRQAPYTDIEYEQSYEDDFES